MATQYSILAWKIPQTEDLVDYRPCGLKELDMTEAAEHACMHVHGVSDAI